MNRWLPHPLLSLSLTLIWLLLVNQLNGGQVLLAVLLGWSIPWLTKDFLVRVPRVRKPLKLGLFLLKVSGDIIIANFHVARMTLGSTRALQPGFVEIPLLIENEFVLALLTSVVSLTPGTVSGGLSPDHKILLLHALHVPQPELLAAQIKRRYEAPLLEIFECSPT